MPDLQVVHLGKPQYERPKGVAGFIGELQDAYKRREETNELDELFNQYQQNKHEEDALEDFNLNLRKSNKISPTKRLEAINEMKGIQEQVLERKKVLNTKAKELEEAARKKREEEKKLADEKEKKEADALKKANAKKESYDALKIANYSDEKAAEMSEYTSPEGARAIATKKITQEKPKPVLKGNKGQDDRINKNVEAGLKAKKLLAEAPKLKEAIKNLGQKGQGWKSYASALPGGTSITERAFDEDEQTISSIVKESLVKSGDLAGLRLTDYKLKYLETASPSPYKSEEANMAAYKLWEDRQKLSAKVLDAQNELLTELSEAGATTLPPDWDRQLEERMENLGLNKDLDNLVEKAKKVDKIDEEKKPNEKVRVKDKKSGRTGTVTPYDGMEKKYDIL